MSDRSDIEMTEEDYEKEFEEIYRMFPEARFSICFSPNMLDDLLTDRQSIIIKHEYNCYCWKGHNKVPKYFYIKGDRLTYKFVINELIRQEFEPMCNHQFLEDIHQTSNSKCQFELWLGS